MKLVSKKESAVSPVIGTILLVAITVVLVAIIAAVVMPMVGGVGNAAVIGVNVNPTSECKLDVTFTSGDYGKIVKLDAIVDGKSTNVLTFSEITSTAAPKLGITYTSTALSTLDANPHDIQLVATLADGAQQIIYQSTVTFPYVAP